MMRAHCPRGRAGWPSAVLSIAVLAILPSAAAAAPSAGNLSPRLAKLASSELREAAPAQQAKALSLAAEGPASLVRQGRRVLVYVRFDEGALASRSDLSSVGAQIIDASGRYQTITASVKPSQLHAVAGLPGVEGVTPVLAPMTAAASCPSGSVVSEGDTQLNARAARETDSLDGSGVTVGILSDSFNQATEAADGSGEPVATKAEDDVKSGDLPGAANECGYTTKVAVLKKEANAAEASDEGRGMAQIVHDLAPGAKLDFASAFNGELAFAQSIKDLATAGAKVIADDVFYFEEPFFQDGPVGVAVNEVVGKGVTYFSAAGNNNLIDEGHDIASWETPEYRDAGSCPPAVEARSGANGFHCLDFNPGPATDKTFGIKVEPGSELTIDLQWDEPWNGVKTDLDAYLLNDSGFLVKESREANVEETQMPVEVLSWENESSATKTVQLVVNRSLGEASPAVKVALLENGGGVESTEYPRSSGKDVVGPTIFGHSGAAGAISTGAIFFNSLTEPEPYSSRGPVRHDFGPVEGTEPAEPLASPELLSKPEIVATDCGKTTFFAEFVANAWHFCGTSAAAPHAAAVAALMLQENPAAEPQEIREALAGSAVQVGAFGSCAVGAGMVEALGAIAAIREPPTGAVGPACEPPTEEVEPDEAQASGNWGSEVPPSPSGGGSPQQPQPLPPEQAEEKSKRVVPPRTFFLQRPSKVIRTRHQQARAVFRFGSNESGASFACRVDGGFFRPCGARMARLFPIGPHVVAVAARDAEGIGDRSPAIYRFKVKRVH